MIPQFIIGIDISKLTLDLAVIRDGSHVESLKIENSVKGIRGLLTGLKKKYQCVPGNTYFCAEHMGLLHRFLVDVLAEKKMTLCLESALRIKRSIGIQRGKNDKLDAIRIGEFAYRNFQTLRPWESPRDCIMELKTLSTLRKKLLKIKVMLASNEKSEQYFLSGKERKEIAAYYQSSLKSLKWDIKQVEQRIATIVKSDEHLARLTTIMLSIPRIGQVIACEILIRTNEFKNISCPRKFASYCGIAPFPLSSGTSVKGRTRVSQIANKDLKRMLHLAAMGSLSQKDTKLAQYYSRKAAQGKNKMSILNAVRNKLVHTVFACVRDNRLYDEKL
jgi:transposase